MNTRNKSRKCKIIHNHLLHVWDFHLWYFSVQPIFILFFFLRFLNSIFYDDLIPSDPRGISSSSSTCSSSASASSCLQTQWIQICSNHNQDFFFITVDSLFNMKYLPLIHCFELNRENIKLRPPNFCYNII